MFDWLITLAVCKSFLQCIYNLYVLQFNEYRPDRFFSYIKRKHGSPLKAIMHFTLFAPISRYQLPSLTSKAVLLISTNIVVHAFLLLLQKPLQLYLVLIALFISPILQLAIIIAIKPLEDLIRKNMYAKATEKIDMCKQSGLTVIGITGSFGKSTTKYFLAHILSSKFSVLSTERSINTPLALSTVILEKLQPSHTIFIAEMGAYKKGEIRELSKIVKPDSAIITGISDQHIELFGSQQNIIEGKSELLESLSSKSSALININSPQKPIIPQSDLRIVEYGKGGNIPSSMKSILQKIGLPGFLYPNVEASIIMARSFGISDSQIEKSLSSLPLPPKTMSISKGLNGCTVINDSFSSNSIGTMAAIDELIKLPNKNKMICMTCLIELGERSANTHREIGEKLSKNDVICLVTTHECFDDLCHAYNTTKASEKCILLVNPSKAATWLKNNVTRDTAILIEGKVNAQLVNLLTEK